MSNARAGLFEADDDFDVSGFAPKKPKPGAQASRRRGGEGGLRGLQLSQPRARRQEARPDR